MKLVCGAECGSIASNSISGVDGHWRLSTGVPVIDTSVYRSGLKSYRFDASATYATMRQYLAGTETVVYGMFYFRMTDVTPSSNWRLLSITSAATNFAMDIETDGSFKFNHHTSNTLSGITLANDTWYGIEFEANISANPNVLKWRAWSQGTGWVEQSQVNEAQAASTFTSGGISIGQYVLGPTSGMSVYVDDMMFGWGTTPGEDYPSSRDTGIVIKRYRPNADGTHSSFSPGDFNATGSSLSNSATTVWQSLDDDSSDSMTDYIEQAVAGDKWITVSLEDESFYTDASAVCFITSIGSSVGGTDEAHVRISDNGTDWTNLYGNWATTGYDFAYGVTEARLSKVVPTKPSGGSWTQSDINGLLMQFGKSDDVSPAPRLHSFSAEVAWSDLVPSSASFDQMGSYMGFFG